MSVEDRALGETLAVLATLALVASLGLSAYVFAECVAVPFIGSPGPCASAGPRLFPASGLGLAFGAAGVGCVLTRESHPRRPFLALSILSLIVNGAIFVMVGLVGPERWHAWAAWAGLAVALAVLAGAPVAWKRTGAQPA